MFKKLIFTVLLIGGTTVHCQYEIDTQKKSETSMTNAAMLTLTASYIGVHTYIHMSRLSNNAWGLLFHFSQFQQFNARLRLSILKATGTSAVMAGLGSACLIWLMYTNTNKDWLIKNIEKVTGCSKPESEDSAEIQDTNTNPQLQDLRISNSKVLIQSSI